MNVTGSHEKEGNIITIGFESGHAFSVTSTLSSVMEKAMSATVHPVKPDGCIRIAVVDKIEYGKENESIVINRKNDWAQHTIVEIVQIMSEQKLVMTILFYCPSNYI